jgi:hypothetical protein
MSNDLYGERWPHLTSLQCLGQEILEYSSANPVIGRLVNELSKD